MYSVGMILGVCSWLPASGSMGWPGARCWGLCYILASNPSNAQATGRQYFITLGCNLRLCEKWRLMAPRLLGVGAVQINSCGIPSLRPGNQRAA